MEGKRLKVNFGVFFRGVLGILAEILVTFALMGVVFAVGFIILRWFGR